MAESFDAIVFYVDDRDTAGLDFPGDDFMAEVAIEICDEAAAPLGIDPARIEFIASDQVDWENGIDRIVCLEAV